MRLLQLMTGSAVVVSCNDDIAAWCMADGASFWLPCSATSRARARVVKSLSVRSRPVGVLRLSTAAFFSSLRAVLTTRRWRLSTRPG